MPLGVEVGLSPDHFVLDGVQALSPKRGGAPPIFGSCLLLPNGFMDQDATWYEVGLGPDDIVLDGDPAPLYKREQPPTQFLAHVYCGQTAGRIKMPLGMEVNLGPGDVVLMGSQIPLKGAQHPSFRFMSIEPNGCWMGEDATWYGSRPWPRPHCVRWGPSSPRNGQSSPLFSVHVYCCHGRPSQLLLMLLLNYWL